MLSHEESHDSSSRTPSTRTKIVAKLGSFGSQLALGADKLGALGRAGRARLDQSMENAKQAGASVASAGASVSQLARDVTDKSLENAKSVGARGADGLRTGLAAGTSGVEKLKSVTADAKGRCGEGGWREAGGVLDEEELRACKEGEE